MAKFKNRNIISLVNAEIIQTQSADQQLMACGFMWGLEQDTKGRSKHWTRYCPWWNGKNDSISCVGKARKENSIFLALY